MATREPRSINETRVPPHSVEAEDSLVGAMLLSRDAISEAVELVSEDDFFQPSLRHVYAALWHLYTAGDPTDVVSVSDQLKRSGVLDQVGGTEKLLLLQASTPAIASASRYAQIVRDYSLLRRLIAAATEIAEQAYASPNDVQEIVDYAEARIFDVAKGNNTDNAVVIRDVLWEALEELEELYAQGGSQTKTASTGFRDLDEKLSGLHRSNLIIVGARPGMGKTSFALSMASKVAENSEDPVLIFSLEMSRIEIGQRLLAGEARVDSMKIRSGRLVEREWDRISHAAGRLAERKIFIDDDPNITVLDIRARSRRLKANEGLSLVMIDYLQLMSSRRNVESRQVEVSEISRGLKLLARELDVPVIALSQLSRNLESRSDKRPLLADLRESGCLAWDTKVRLGDGSAETIGMLWAKGREHFEVVSATPEGKAVVALAKRVVATGVKPLLHIEFTEGGYLDATYNHPIATPSGFVRADALAIGGRVLALDQEGTVDAQTIASLEPMGSELVFDIEVVDTHCFYANDALVHNSLEQDADIVMFIYRDEAYRPDSPDRGVAEIIIAKHRSGPVGTVHLAFMENWALFADIAQG
ncbi:replicative DNA helicase [Ferrimicrobium acidiphilum]|uniref:replicative DNA helicase n=2 Tax=Ferrimicrobium acidiphilum TaxID=121039 RepID=UPI0023F298C1|nr:replicative DNA helicase [Ferrimicrobium acidiphilum]